MAGTKFGRPHEEEEELTELREMATVPTTSTMRVLGAVQSDHKLEFASLLAKAWAAFHANGPLWRTKWSLHAN